MGVPDPGGFCPDPLFSLSQSWNTSSPDVSVCLVKTVLVMVPCGALWLTFPPYLYSLLRSETRQIPQTALNVVKTVLGMGLVLLGVGDLGMWVNQELSTPADIMDPVIRIITWILVVVIVQVERNRGCRNSCVGWIFWVVYLIFSVPRLYSQAKRRTSTGEESTLDDAELASTSLAFGISLILWILAFLVDDQPLYIGPGPIKTSPNPSPELSASFPSNLTFSWFSSMCWSGFRRSIVAEDLWDLNPRDASTTLVPKFNSFWDPQLKSANLEQRNENCVSHAYFNSDLDTAIVTPTKSTKKNKRDGLSVFQPLIKTFGVSFLCSSSLKLLHTILTFIPPLLLKNLIEFSENQDPIWKGILYAILLFCSTMVQTIVFTQFSHWMSLMGIWIKSCLVSAIYRKSLTVTAQAKKNSCSGEVVNLMSVDCQRICDMTQSINMLWDVPLKVIIALWWLWQLLGPSVLAGVGMMILLIPVNGVLVFMMRNIQIQQMKAKDVRMKKMNELLRGIKILKLYAWENSFMKEVEQIRNGEIKLMKRMSYFFVGMYFIMSCTPFIITLVTFGTYVLSSPENILDSTKAFTALALFNIISFPLSFLPMVISGTVQASVSVNRINQFMKNEELDPNAVEKSEDTKSNMAVDVQNATFQWDREISKEIKEPQEIPKIKKKASGKLEGETLVNGKNGNANIVSNGGDGRGQSFALKDITFNIPRGSLCAVVGSVGSGKSSLLSCLLGDMIKTTGQVKVNGRIAYVSQQPWIQNSTLKQNILFESNKDDDFYDKVLDDCALLPDLKMLPAGDQTEIGENGINLSGGQRARVSLARAVYSGADVYLLDDPMSAVDSQVGKHLFERVIGPSGSLADTTRILVTHGLTYLPLMDQIIVLREGTISEIGTYKELVEQQGDFSEFLMQYLSEKEESGKKHEEVIEDDLEKTDAKKDDGGNPKKQKQYNDEKSATGHVSWRVYSLYFRNMGYCTLCCCILFFALFQVFKAMSAVWLTIWTDVNTTVSNHTLAFINESQIIGVTNESQTNAVANETQLGQNTKVDFYLGVYAAWGLAQAIMIMLATLLLYAGILSGAKKFHHNMLRGILRAPMAFFDTTPQGRIINRFGKDIDVLDTVLPRMLSMLLISIFNVTVTLLVIVGVVPEAAVPIFVVLLIYYGVQKVYVATSRQLKRLESVSRSPIYSHFGETVAGASTIRAYGLEQRFIVESERRVDENHKASFVSVICTRWLAIRLETIGNVIILAAALLVVLGRDNLSPGLVGLGVSYSLQVTMALNWFVRNVSDMEANIVAVERMQEYTDVTQEDDLEKEDTAPAEDWPAQGNIRLEGYCLRYREGLDLVLKDITAEMAGGTRVGIVGRTGAGKSSLTLALFRLIEPAAGTITIDGLDITSMGLHQLRSRLTIIPQDPVLFSGSLRKNLDPFDSYPDDRLHSALRQAHLLPYVRSLEAGLLHEVAEGGENMSVGQRQLVCLARALLRKTKVLVLDEATAAVDLETDDLIQQTIRTEFTGCTVITIAHRINTIVDYDQVMVLEEGRLVEMDNPAVLREREGSIFRSMCQDAGI